MISSIFSTINGNKTYAVGISLILYIIVQQINGAEVNMELVSGMLAGMGLTIRHGISKAN